MEVMSADRLWWSGLVSVQVSCVFPKISVKICVKTWFSCDVFPKFPRAPRATKGGQRHGKKERILGSAEKIGSRCSPSPRFPPRVNLLSSKVFSAGVNKIGKPEVRGSLGSFNSSITQKPWLRQILAESCSNFGGKRSAFCLTFFGQTTWPSHSKWLIGVLRDKGEKPEQGRAKIMTRQWCILLTTAATTAAL